MENLLMGELAPVELGVETALCQQILVPSLLHDLTLIQNNNQITVLYCSQSVSNNQHGFISKLVIDHIKNNILR